MFQPTPDTETPLDAYDGVPLGVEAMVQLPRTEAFEDAALFLEGAA